MNKYIEPEFLLVELTSEDILTKSTLDDATSGWETESSQSGGGSVPIIGL